MTTPKRTGLTVAPTITRLVHSDSKQSEIDRYAANGWRLKSEVETHHEPGTWKLTFQKAE